MLTHDQNSPMLASGQDTEIDAFLASFHAGGEERRGQSLESTFVDAVGEVLGAAAGTAVLTLSGPLHLSSHTFTLARGGTLRRSRGQSSRTEIAVLPTAALPGALLRLAGIAPTEPLSSQTRIDLAQGTLEDLFCDEGERRGAAWRLLMRVAASLPEAAPPELDSAEPRAAQLVRRRGEGDRVSRIVMVRGRYLVPAETGPGVMRGADPTGAARTLLSGMLRPQE